ncbi:MAG: hypothetical protein RJA70_1678 [Pseudomonadota bacterium]|jgi:hypothetical protein
MVSFACGTHGEHNSDPSADDPEESTYRPSGEVILELGIFQEQRYRPIKEGDALPIIYGLQGGTWVMPAVRARGIELDVHLRAQLETSSGEMVGTVSADTRFVVASDGWVEIAALPIPVQHEPPNEFESINDLYGEVATLQIEIEDKSGRSSGVSRQLVLTMR